MKRILSVILCGLLLLTALPVLSASAAESDFVIEDGVLLSYRGSDTAVTVPEGVVSIADSAFENNQKITSVTLPSSLYTVGKNAFSGCAALSAVSGGQNVGEVGYRAFYGTPYFENSTARYLMLGTVLIWYNGTAESVSIPTACTAIAPYAFARCDTVTSFTAHEGLLTIGDGAFYQCGSLSEVQLPATLSEVGAYAFDGTPYLQSLGEYPTVGDGVLVKYQGSETDVVIPEGIRRISPRAFSSSKLSSVIIPDSVYSVDPYAFADCTGLTSVEFSDGLVNIGDGAFSGCKSLSTVRTPESLAYLGQYAFCGDTALESASLIGSGLTVSDNAFKDCTDLRYALLSNGAEQVNDNAFLNCTALNGISVGSTVKAFSGSALSGCKNVTVSCEKGSAAANAGYKTDTLKGDVDNDQELTITDATGIQRRLVQLTDFTGLQAAKADLNYDGILDIFDASYIQLLLAGMIG